MIGLTNRTNIVDCGNGAEPPLPAHGGMGIIAGTIAMGYSKSLLGPWSEPRVILQNANKPTQNQSNWDCYVTNPSAIVHPDGTVMLVFSSVPCEGGFEEALGAAYAPHWNSTYVEDTDNAIWRKPGPRNSPPATGPGNIEDPFVWVDARGNYHIVAHSQGTMSVCGGQSHKTGKGGPGNACGIHLFAENPHGPWTPSVTPVYTGQSGTFTNGSAVNFTTRQRPQIVFDADGTTPKYMLNGGSFDEYNQGTTSLERTFMFEFQQE